jgi:[methyl-Co(III) methanol-specific corrinoid protein]:coenzyme M methyltransferase
MRELAGDELSLMGGVSNLGALRKGTADDVRRQAADAASAGINIVGPECAVPLDAKVANLKAVSEQIKAT